MTHLTGYWQTPSQRAGLTWGQGIGPALPSSHLRRLSTAESMTVGMYTRLRQSVLSPRIVRSCAGTSWCWTQTRSDTPGALRERPAMRVCREAVQCQVMRRMTAWLKSGWFQACQLITVESGQAVAPEEGRPRLWSRQPTSSAQLHCTSHSIRQPCKLFNLSGPETCLSTHMYLYPARQSHGHFTEPQPLSHLLLQESMSPLATAIGPSLPCMAQRPGTSIWLPACMAAVPARPAISSTPDLLVDEDRVPICNLVALQVVHPPPPLRPLQQGGPAGLPRLLRLVAHHCVEGAAPAWAHRDCVGHHLAPLVSVPAAVQHRCSGSWPTLQVCLQECSRGAVYLRGWSGVHLRSGRRTDGVKYICRGAVKRACRCAAGAKVCISITCV